MQKLFITPFTYKQFFWFIALLTLSYQACGWISHFWVTPGEPFYSRLLLSLPGVILLGLVYIQKLSLKQISVCFYLLLFIGNGQFLYYSLIHELNLFYSCGLFAVMATSSLLIFNTLLLRLYHVTISLSTSLLLYFSLPTEQNDLFLFNFLSFNFICYFFQKDKIITRHRLSQSIDDLKAAKQNLQATYKNNLQAAHDLRSPVSAIHSAASVLKYENKKAYTLLLNSIERINEISSTLLTEHNEHKQQIAADFFDLENNISKLINDKRMEFKEITQLFIGYRVTAPILEEVKIPEMDFYRVFSNLINNSVDALKNKQIKRINIVLTPRTGFVDIYINDNGAGIPREEQNDIFLEGYSSKGGTGIGLSHARNHARQWGGDIHLDKSGPNGTTFKLSVPTFKG